ncbi:MAG: PBP1b-binding outer membrane lipoprotein LpoB [Phenylobacterium sp.]|jgi:PBP1b-binding outer membrane lipoprotein LpoB
MTKFKMITMIWLGILLSGCSSIPIATMLSFSNYDAEQFFAIKAQDMRVRATINSGLGIDLVTATNIALLVTTANGETKLNLVLEQIKIDTVAAKKGLFSDTPEFAVHTLKLSDEGVDNFNRFAQLMKTQEVKKTGFSAGFNSDKPLNSGGYAIYFSLDIKLGKSQDFVTLIDQFEVPSKYLATDNKAG